MGKRIRQKSRAAQKEHKELQTRILNGHIRGVSSVEQRSDGEVRIHLQTKGESVLLTKEKERASFNFRERKIPRAA